MATFAVSGALVAFGLGVWRGPSGIGLGAELVQGFAQLLFIAALGFPVLAERTPGIRHRDAALLSRNLIYAFAGSYTVFLLIVALHRAVRPESTPLAVLIYLTVNALILAVLIAVARARLDGDGDSRIPRTVHILALAYFWCFFLLLDCVRIGRSRLADPYFMFALALLVAALVFRAARLWSSRRGMAGKVG